MQQIAICLTLLFAARAFGQAQTATQSPLPAPTANAPVAKADENVQPVVSDAETLAAAYKREFAFLAEQKRELTERLKEFRANSQKAEQSLRQRIAATERENIELSNREDSLRTQLTTAEHKDESLHERSELLEMTYSQANSTLKNYGRSLEKNPVFSEGDNDVKLTMLFDEAYGLLQELGQIRKQEEKFFLLDGTEVEGSIVYVGNIAAYGASSRGSGILVPAGNNRFRLWPEPAADVAEGLASGKPVSSLKMFLFESKEKAIDLQAEKTVIDIIESGGLIGWVIVALGVLALILAAIRAGILYLNSASAKTISAEVFALLAQKNRDQALAICQERRGPFARLLEATLKHAQAERDHLEDVISETLLHESGPLNRFGSTILVIASVSPLLGLLGTVTGMISTFDIITEFGTGDPKLLSGGISIALVTTELGLIVAIPTVLLGTMLNSWAESIKMDLEEAALKASNIVLGNVPRAAAMHPKIKLKGDETDLEVAEIGYATT
ncbi:MAG: MotA/TolQ/ExbB proton channel family protein [Methylomicrobium sp.]